MILWEIAMTAKQRLEKHLGSHRIARVYRQAEAAFRGKNLIGHGWDHIYRDILNAVVIGDREQANMDIVLPATILHDIGFLYDPDASVHPQIGAQRCAEWLEEWNPEEQERIARCILVHKGKMREFNLEPDSLEEQVVCDADMLEKTGWLGVLQAVRVFCEFAQNGKPEYYQLYNLAAAIAKVKSVTFYTATGRRLASERGGYLRGEVYEKALRELDFYR